VLGWRCGRLRQAGRAGECVRPPDLETRQAGPPGPTAARGYCHLLHSRASLTPKWSPPTEPRAAGRATSPAHKHHRRDRRVDLAGGVRLGNHRPRARLPNHTVRHVPGQRGVAVVCQSAVEHGGAEAVAGRRNLAWLIGLQQQPPTRRVSGPTRRSRGATRAGRTPTPTPPRFPSPRPASRRPGGAAPSTLPGVRRPLPHLDHEQVPVQGAADPGARVAAI
jgi:hypothetical protein